jgi:hypothetical protein
MGVYLVSLLPAGRNGSAATGRWVRGENEAKVWHPGHCESALLGLWRRVLMWRDGSRELNFCGV